MAANYSVDFSGKDNLSQTINKVKRELEGVKTAGDKLDSLDAKFNKINNSAGTYQQKIRQINNLMAQMNVDGLGGTALYAQMAQAAANYTDAIGDARTATRLLSSDTATLQAGVQAMQGLAAAGSIATGVMSLLGVEDDKVKESLLKVQSAMAILNGVQAISNTLNKDSILVLKLKSTWNNAINAATAANTASTVTNTAATAANTAAKNAGNIALAVGKALLGDVSGLLIVAAAGLATYAIATGSQTDEQKKLNKETEKTKEATNDLASAMAQSVSKFYILQNSWSKLRTEQEKNKFLKDNAKEFENLGLKIKDVNQAELTFVDNSNIVVRALQARAQEAALYKQIVTAYETYYNELDRIEQKRDELNHKTGGGRKSEYQQLETDRKAAESALDKTLDKVSKRIDKVKEEYAGVLDFTPNDKSDTSNKGKQQIVELNLGDQRDEITKWVEDIYKQAQQIAKQHEFGIISEDQANKELTALNDKLKSFGLKANVDLITRVIPKDGLEKLKSELHKLEEQRNNLPLDADPTVLINKIKELKKQIEAQEIKLGIKVDEKEIISQFDATLKSLQGFASVANYINNIGSAFENCKTGLDYFTTGLNMVVSAMETYNTISEIANVISERHAALKAAEAVQDTATTSTKIANATAETAAEEVKAGAHMKSAAAEFFEAHAWIPYVGAALAGAMIGVMVASMAKFATGGIVPGNSYSGDKVMAGLNSGEMVLNKRQQSNLFNMIDHGGNNNSFNGGQVEFVIRDRQLIGVLSNSINKNSKLL